MIVPYTNPSSAKFLFKTVTSLSNNESLKAESPTIPLNSIQIRDKILNTEKLTMKSNRNLNKNCLFTQKSGKENSKARLNKEK